MNNPLLETNELPAFDRIQAVHVEPAVDQALKATRTAIDDLLERAESYSRDSLIAPLELALEKLHRVWSPVSHLNAVMNTDELRSAYNACLPKLSEFRTEIGQLKELYKAFKAIADSDEFNRLDQAQKKLIENQLRDFRLAGIELDEKQQSRLKRIQQQLSRLNARFQENLLDATRDWKKHIQDEKLLAGLPDHAISLAKQAAKSEQLDGWLLTLDFPSFYPVQAYADNRKLREEVYTAYITRASELGPGNGQWDNSDVMEDILRLRHEAAQLLGYPNYAERSLVTKMASSVTQVMDFLSGLSERTCPIARKELEELREFALSQGGPRDLEAWDVSYYSEKLRQHRYALSQEELKPWFPVSRVLPGLFSVVGKLFGIQVKQRKGASTWHPDVEFYEIHDESGRLRGRFYLDLYARKNKRGGAWMDDCASRMDIGGYQQLPVAYLTCNFTPPIGDQPALLTHNEVQTLFHEFGHGLHHMLTLVDYPAVSGINGVSWDAVELPSQFLENWCWEREALDLISGHVDSGQPIPDELFERMLAARNFQSAMQMIRQLEFAIFDMRVHTEYLPEKGGRIYEILNDVRQHLVIIQPPEFNRFAHGFSHIFGGGYAAGYYSYKWAEVLSADAYSLFEDNGVFDRKSGDSFMRNILEQGGCRDPMELYINFRGRKPDINALLRHAGLAT